MTHNLKFFALFSFIWSLPFFVVLEWVVQNSDKRGPLMLPTSILFGIGFSVAGRQFGKREKPVRYALRLRYGLIAGVIPSVIGSIWVLGWHRSQINYLLSYVGAIVLCILIYYALNRKTFKGITKKELFK
jgi:FtsH-binding integral membrane protein